jgi:hypothetical protein
MDHAGVRKQQGGKGQMEKVERLLVADTGTVRRSVAAECLQIFMRQSPAGHLIR